MIIALYSLPEIKSTCCAGRVRFLLPASLGFHIPLFDVRESVRRHRYDFAFKAPDVFGLAVNIVGVIQEHSGCVLDH